MIYDLFTTQFTVKRDVWTQEEIGEETIDKSQETEIETFMGYRQQASAEDVQSLGLTMTKPHKVWCSVGADVEEGDVLVSSYGVDTVKAKQVNRDGENAHIELMVEHTKESVESESS